MAHHNDSFVQKQILVVLVHPTPCYQLSVIGTADKLSKIHVYWQVTTWRKWISGL